MLEPAGPAPLPHDAEVRRFAIRAAAFLVALVTLATVAHRVILLGYSRQQGGAYGSWNRIEQGRASTEIAIFGSSSALIDFDCELIGARTHLGCLNFGMAAGFNDLLVPTTTVLLEHNRPPRVAVLTLNIMSLMVNNQPTDSSQFLPYLDEPALFAHLVRVDPQFWYWRYVPLFGVAVDGIANVRFAVAGLMGKVIEPRPLGFHMIDMPWDGTFEEFVRNAPQGTTYAIDDLSVKATHQVLRAFRERGIRVVLLITPDWVGVRPYELNQEEIMGRFASLAKQYDLPLLDYFHDPISADQSLFYNARHLNRKGTRLFAERVADDLLRVLGSDGR